MKKIIATLIAIILLLSLSLPSVAVSKTEWQGLKDIAELVKSISLNDISREAGAAITEGLSNKYGYGIATTVSCAKDGRFFSSFEIPEEYKDEDVEWRYLYYACDRLVTKEQILTVMKELYPMLTDELAEEIFNLPTDTDYGYWYVETDLGYAVGQIPSGGGPYHVYNGYTEDNNVFHFYYTYTSDAIRLNAPSLEYDGKTYYSTHCYYEPVIDSDDYEDIYVPLNEVEYNGKTYYRSSYGNFKASYYALPESEQVLAELAEKTNQPGLVNSIQYNGKTYYEYLEGFYASSGFMAEIEDDDEKLEEPILYINDNYYFYCNGHYYGFPEVNVDPVWDSVKLDMTKIPVVEANGLKYVIKYSSYASDYSTENGEILSEFKKSISFPSSPETITYNGDTYFDSNYGYIMNADFGKEIVIKVENGKAVSLSSGNVEKFPENRNMEYTEPQTSISQGNSGSSASNNVTNDTPKDVITENNSSSNASDVTYDMPKGVIIASNGSFPAGTTVTAKEIKDGTAFDIAKKALADISSKFIVFDFSAVKNGATVQPNGKVKVTINVPETLSVEDLKMFYVSDKGEMQELEISIDKNNKTATAELEHFSTYVLANVSTSPKTGDNFNTMLLVFLCVSSFALAFISFILIKKEKLN